MNTGSETFKDIAERLGWSGERQVETLLEFIFDQHLMPVLDAHINTLANEERSAFESTASNSDEAE